ncbi:phage related lysozyme [Abyssogena phaseoliformis symbiont OG214]|nr:lysozyme [Abyssogena phaseoliformis symbiont]BBB22358.1 phage related lysozyme [Abyssogena phaseoliformis symbiont OG214]
MPYQCSVGKLTIGYGHNLDANGISAELANSLLENDVDKTCRELQAHKWFNTLSVARKVALVDMCFNLGLPRLLKFKLMIVALKTGNYELVAKEMLDSKWDNTQQH